MARDFPCDGSGERGFTLIEMMVAVVILIVAAVSVAELVPASISYDLRNRNDSTALIAAERLSEQMALQALTSSTTICPNNSIPATNYGFCDNDNDAIALGDIAAGSPTSVGCPLTAAGQLDFSQPSTACAAGYTITKTYTWNPSIPTTQSVELRWAVVTMRNAGTPYRKVFIVGGRAGSALQSLTVTSVRTVVGK
jgi:prepilin-type N-terminal cleavage/methylation domain-containing protein